MSSRPAHCCAHHTLSASNRAAFGWDSCDKGGTWYKTIQAQIDSLKVSTVLAVDAASSSAYTLASASSHQHAASSPVTTASVLTLTCVFVRLSHSAAGPDMHTPVVTTSKPVCQQPGEALLGRVLAGAQPAQQCQHLHTQLTSCCVCRLSPHINAVIPCRATCLASSTT